MLQSASSVDNDSNNSQCSDNSSRTSITDDTDHSNIIDSKDPLFQKSLTIKERYHYKHVHNFFKKTNKKNIKKMCDIIDGKDKISLRLLDWFVTRHALQYTISYPLEGHNNSGGFFVNISYKSHLKAYKKKYFDPFRRRKKILYVYSTAQNKLERLKTTIGQLNFFKWAFEYNVIKYIEDNYDMVSKAMVKSNKNDKIRKLECEQKKNNNASSDDIKSTKSNNSNKNNKSNKSKIISIKKDDINIKAKKNMDDKNIEIILSFD